MQLPVPERSATARVRSQRWIPLLLLLLALSDLRTELRLLADQVTLTALIFAVRHHLLAVVVLVLQPSLWFHYGPRHRRVSNEIVDTL
nr:MULTISPECIES: hypothetical protein [unclassified Synechococcus]